jgi:hypothetical protein
VNLILVDCWVSVRHGVWPPLLWQRYDLKQVGSQWLSH